MQDLAARKYPRLDAILPVWLTLGARVYREKTKTVGGGGLFITGAHQVPEGGEFQLRFKATKALALIEAVVRVCYTQPGVGMGVEFTSIQDHDRQTLLRWIHKQQLERRVERRAPLVAQVESPEFTALAYAQDISTGGMFITTNDSVALASPVTLRFYLHPNEPMIAARGEVVYCVEKLGLGVHFTYIDPVDLSRIQAYVREHVKVVAPSGSASC